jgi:predicted Fe-S protein YdhL (DUF1289 family)
MRYSPSETPAEPTLQTPCVRNCCLDQHEVCLGCGRHLDEILRWHHASSEERSRILARASARRRR